MVIQARLPWVGLAVFLLAGSQLAFSGAALAAGPFDGTYVGTQHETVNNNSSYCSNINRDSIRRVVKDGIITTEWSKATLQATIEADGSFATSAEGMQFGRAGSNPNPITFRGTIHDGQLEADVGGAHCAAHWSLRKN